MISSLQPRRPTILQPQVFQPQNQCPSCATTTLVHGRIEVKQPLRPQPHVTQPRQYDSASQHPVFFTARMVKLPNGVMSAGASPVATGYQFEERREDGFRGAKQKL